MVRILSLQGIQPLKLIAIIVVFKCTQPQSRAPESESAFIQILILHILWTLKFHPTYFQICTVNKEQIEISYSVLIIKAIKAMLRAF